MTLRKPLIGFVLALLCVASACAQTTNARQQVVTLGLGHRIKVKQTQQHRVKGVITSIDDTTFTVTPRHHAPAVTIPYSQVSALSEHSHTAWLREGPCGGPISLVVVTGLIVGLAIAL